MVIGVWGNPNFEMNHWL